MKTVPIKTRPISNTTGWHMACVDQSVGKTSFVRSVVCQMCFGVDSCCSQKSS